LVDVVFFDEVDDKFKQFIFKHWAIILDLNKAGRWISLMSENGE
jgi:hypothetical protein